MLEIRITAPELSEAINNLARAMTVRAETTPNGTTVGAVPTNTTYAVAEPQAQAPVNVPPVNNATPPVNQAAPQFVPTAQTPTAAPVAQAPVTQAPNSVPTAAPQYTLEMIAKAGTALVDAGKTAEVSALLARYGVEVLTALDPAMYGSIAMELRALGAQI